MNNQYWTQGFPTRAFIKGIPVGLIPWNSPVVPPLDFTKGAFISVFFFFFFFSKIAFYFLEKF